MPSWGLTLDLARILGAAAFCWVQYLGLFYPNLLCPSQPRTSVTQSSIELSRCHCEGSALLQNLDSEFGH